MDESIINPNLYLYIYIYIYIYINEDHRQDNVTPLYGLHLHLVFSSFFKKIIIIYHKKLLKFIINGGSFITKTLHIFYLFISLIIKRET